MKSEDVKKQKKTNESSDSQKKSDTSKVARLAANGEIQYGRTVGRHGIDDERTLNPEE